MQTNNASLSEIPAEHQSGANYTSSTVASVKIQLDRNYEPDGAVKIICDYDNVDGSNIQTCITWLTPDRAVQLGVCLIQAAAILPAEVKKLHEERAEKKRQVDQKKIEKIARQRRTKIE